MTEGVTTEPSLSFASVDLFQKITKLETNQKILNLHSSKACQESDLPTKIIKANSDIFTEVIHKERNRGLEVCNFPCFCFPMLYLFIKKAIDQRKVNYRPVSIQSNISKVFERLF